MIDRININGVTYSATALEAGAQATGITITVDGVTYLLGDVIAPMKEQAASTEASGNIDKISVNGVVYDIRDVEDVAAERKRAMEAEGAIRDNFSEELLREADARMFADNDIRRKGVLFGGFSNRRTTANEVVIAYMDIDQKNEGAFSVPAATTEKAGVMTAADKQKLDSLSPGGGGGGGVAELMEEVTYSELVALRDNASLVAGMKYRITDYVATTVQQDTKSANHPFDVIVEAVSENELSELAQAIHHEGDTYFDGNDLGAWQLWYSLDNDTTKYAWADAENGKGVIYRMIDEKKNDCPYDFKNILFYTTYYGSDTTSDKYYYTFSYVVSGVLYDGTIEGRVTRCHNNSIGVYTSSGKSRLNSNIFRNTTFGSDCNSNTFGYYCSSNTFGDGCHSNTFGYYCYSNTFGDYCHSNTFGDGCHSNTFGYYCYSNTFGDYCSSNTFGDGCHSNTFGYYCSSNTFGGSTDNRKLDKNRTSITLNKEYYDDGTNALVPIRHPDLSTQPNILPYKFMGQYVYEQLIPKELAYYDASEIMEFILDEIGLACYPNMILNAAVIYSGGCCSAGANLYSDDGITYLQIRKIVEDSTFRKDVNFVRIIYTTMPEEGNYYGYNNY